MSSVTDLQPPRRRPPRCCPRLRRPPCCTTSACCRRCAPATSRRCSRTSTSSLPTPRPAPAACSAWPSASPAVSLNRENGHTAVPFRTPHAAYAMRHACGRQRVSRSASPKISISQLPPRDTKLTTQCRSFSRCSPPRTCPPQTSPSVPTRPRRRCMSPPRSAVRKLVSSRNVVCKLTPSRAAAQRPPHRRHDQGRPRPLASRVRQQLGGRWPDRR